MSLDSDLVFVVRVTLPADAADEMRRVEDDGIFYESTDEQLTADALTYFRGWHSESVIETIDAIQVVVGEPYRESTK